MYYILLLYKKTNIKTAQCNIRFQSDLITNIIYNTLFLMYMVRDIGEYFLGVLFCIVFVLFL